MALSQFIEHVYSGDIEECPSREEHGNASDWKLYHIHHLPNNTNNCSKHSLTCKLTTKGSLDSLHVCRDGANIHILSGLRENDAVIQCMCTFEAQITCGKQVTSYLS